MKFQSINYITKAIKHLTKELINNFGMLLNMQNIINFKKVIKMDTDDINNIKKRLEDAQNLKANLEAKLEKLGDNPRAETFQIQLDKVNDLIKHLEHEREELEK